MYKTVSISKSYHAAGLHNLFLKFKPSADRPVGTANCRIFSTIITQNEEFIPHFFSHSFNFPFNHALIAQLQYLRVKILSGR
ncbi:hypothetical protein OC25_00475 [Pedobacter kyungheensis]|uniref:Uncharacterized protein n=1 Tax=Pedobacter kyungheensis TaxID=1069985 RepID=A0A0C1DH02_9SPHI|nr:hypothetical protein OC25_00475 [Pedobacter kyungheensis]